MSLAVSKNSFLQIDVIGIQRNELESMKELPRELNVSSLTISYFGCVHRLVSDFRRGGLGDNRRSMPLLRCYPRHSSVGRDKAE